MTSQNIFVISCHFLVIPQKTFVNSDNKATSLAAQTDAKEPMCPSMWEEKCAKKNGVMSHFFEFFVFPVF